MWKTSSPVVLTLVAVVPSTVERAATESLHRDLNRVGVWCDFWGMKLNMHSSSQVNPIDSGWNSAEGIC